MIEHEGFPRSFPVGHDHDLRTRIGELPLAFGQLGNLPPQPGEHGIGFLPGRGDEFLLVLVPFRRGCLQGDRETGIDRPELWFGFLRETEAEPSHVVVTVSGFVAEAEAQDGAPGGDEGFGEAQDSCVTAVDHAAFMNGPSGGRVIVEHAGQFQPALFMSGFHGRQRDRLRGRALPFPLHAQRREDEISAVRARQSAGCHGGMPEDIEPQTSPAARRSQRGDFVVVLFRIGSAVQNGAVGLNGQGTAVGLGGLRNERQPGRSGGGSFLFP